MQSEVYKAIEGDTKVDRKEVLLKIPKDMREREADGALVYAKVKTRTTLLAGLCARLYRYKSIFIKDPKK